MAKKRLFDLPQTKGEFQIKGIASGVKKNTFFTTKKTKSNVDMNLVNFGIKYDDNQTAYVSLNGMVSRSVYYYNSELKKTVEVSWANRHNTPGDGYKLIGARVGLTTTTNEKGDVVNDNKMLSDYDAAKYIADNLKDDMPIFVKGALEFGSYVDKNGDVQRSKRLALNQVSLSSKEIDFDAEDYKALADFKTTIVFESIEKEKDDNGLDTGRFIVNAIIVGYSDITNTDFVVENAKLANLMKKNLKAYNAIEVTGVFKNTIDTSESDAEDSWGDKNSYNRANKKGKFEYVITGAAPGTIDTETYTEENIAAARKAIANKDKLNKNFGETKEDTSSTAPWEDSSDSDNGDDVDW